VIRAATLGDRPAIREMLRQVWHATCPYISLVAHVEGEIAG
jgi:hypothetical protein